VTLSKLTIQGELKMRVALIQCTKSKKAYKCPARELYYIQKVHDLGVLILWQR